MRRVDPVASIRGMQRTYGVVWREGNEPVRAGKLELSPRAVRLEGRGGTREIALGEVSGVRVGRTPHDRVDGRPSVVVERIGADDVAIAGVGTSQLVGEIVERLTELRRGTPRTRRLVLVLPLKPGGRDDVAAVLASGPPFDPGEVDGLARHEVFLTGDEVVFLFEAEGGTERLTELLARPEIWEAAASWREYLSGPPRVADVAFSWSRPQDDANVYYLPTPGPGDSDGGDIY